MDKKSAKFYLELLSPGIKKHNAKVKKLSYRSDITVREAIRILIND